MKDAKEDPIKTQGIPISKLPKCVKCKKYVGPVFHAVDVRMGVIDQRGARQVAGIMMGFGFPLGLAEVFSSYDDPVRVTDDPRVDVRIYLCNECYCESDIPILVEKSRPQQEPEESQAQLTDGR
jgi:hypothetical protein